MMGPEYSSPRFAVLCVAALVVLLARVSNAQKQTIADIISQRPDLSRVSKVKQSLLHSAYIIKDMKLFFYVNIADRNAS